MAKIELDKYYTSDDLAKYCVEKTKEIIGEENITEYLEPSAGSGTTKIACMNSNRNYIVNDKDEKYYNIILRR